jgi:translocation and assembly module TamB
VQGPRTAIQAHRGRLGRTLGGIGIALLLGALFTGASAAALLLHLDLPATRRIVRDAANGVLASIFRGAIIVERLDHVSVGGVEVGAARVVDPAGGTVIHANGIHARADVLAIVASALRGSGELHIAIPRVRIDDADVLIEPDATGHLGIADAFEMPPAAPPPPGAPPRPSRGVVVEMPAIEIGHAHARGALAPPRSLDADVSRLRAAIRIAPDGFSLDVARTGLVDRSFLPATTAGAAEYHLRVLPPPAPGAPGVLRMWTELGARVGAVELLARAALENGHLTAILDVPTATPAELATVVSGLPLRLPASAHAEIDGPIPSFDVSARVTLEAPEGAPEQLRVDGRLDASGPIRAQADAVFDEIDPSALDARLPAGRIDGAARVLAEGGPIPRLSVDARTNAAMIEGRLVPATELHADLVDGGFVGGARLEEPGMPVDATFEAARGAVALAARTEIPSIRGAPRIAGPVDGAATVRVTGQLADGRLDARVDATGRGLSTKGGVSLGSARVLGRVTGPLDRLSVDAAVTGDDLRAGGWAWGHVTASARGPITSPALEARLDDDAGGELRAGGRLDTKEAAVRDVRLRVRRDADEVEGKVARIGASPGGGVTIEGASLAGSAIGSLAGGLAIRDGDVTGELKGEGVDLARAAKLAGVVLPVHGLADLDVALKRGPKGRDGHVELEIEDAGVTGFEGVSAHLTATFESDHVRADAMVRLVGDGPPAVPAAPPAPPPTGPASPAGLTAGPTPRPPREDERCDGTIASVRLVDGDGLLRGPLLEPATWRRLTGTATVAAEDWKLACIRAKVPALRLLFGEVAGTVTARLLVARPEGQRFPSVGDLLARTEGFEISGPPRALLDPTPTWAWGCQDRAAGTCRPVDAQLTGRIDGATGKGSIDLGVFSDDVLASASVEATLDFGTLLEKPALRAASLRATPFLARFTVPSRLASTLARLPTLARDALPPFAGVVGIEAYADGTFEQPFASVRVHGQHLAAAESLGGTAVSPWAMPLDVEALATYDASHGTLDATARQDGVSVATITGELDADLHALLSGSLSAEPRWTGGVYAKLDALSLDGMAALSDRGVKGHLGGTVSIADLNVKPALRVALGTTDLRLGPDSPAQRGELSVAIEGDTAAANMSLVPQAGGGLLSFGATASVTWLGGALPAPNLERPGAIELRTEHFDLAALRPLLADAVSDVGGRLDGKTRVAWRRLAQGDAAEVTAAMTVEDGLVNLPQIGQELHGARLRITAAPGQPIRVQDLLAEGIAGKVTGNATVELEGLRFRKADADLVIADDLPLTFEGVPIGNARGEVKLAAEMREQALALDVTIPKLHVELPATPRLGVQTLDDDPDVTISLPLGPPTESRPRNATPIVVTVQAKDVQIEGEAIGGGNGLDVVLASVPDTPPRIEITDKTRLSGDIQVVRGKVDLYGKLLELDQGLCRLRPEDPGNPYVNVLAHWDAPDGSRITVGWDGPLKPMTDAKLILRSDPPRAGGRQEILAALLFGVTPGETTTPALTTSDTSQQGTGAGTAAVGVGGGLAAAQLSTLLSGTLLRGLSARFGTTAEGSLATTLQYQLGQKVIAAASFENAPGAATPTGTQPGTGSTASTTTQTSTLRGSRTELSIDWRFAAKWSLRATVGMEADQPTSGLDLLWQYRY